MTAEPLVAEHLPGPDASGTILRVRDLRKSYGATVLLDGVDLDVHKDEDTVILGPSGAGKSTLLRCVNNLERPTSGRVELSENTRVGMVFQGFTLFPQLNVLENIVLAPTTVFQVPRTVAVRTASDLLARVGLAGYERAYADELTGGQQQRAAIARALAVEPDLFLVDDPTSALDPAEADEVLAILREVARAGTTMVVATHEIGFAHDVADRVVFLDGGRIVQSGTAAEVIGDVHSEQDGYFPSSVL